MEKEKRALGKGLSALIPGKTDSPGAEDPVKSDLVQVVSIDKIRRNSLQPRGHYDEEKLEDLKASIHENGLLQPILVREVAGGYEVIAGERRLRAAKASNLQEIPVIIKKVSDQEALVLALVENIQREELNAIEEAQAYRRLIAEFNLTQDEVAQSVGKDRSTISNTLRLLNLPDDIQQSVVVGNLSMGHARALLSVEDPQDQRRVFETAIQKGLSVREVENLTKIDVKIPPRRKTPKEKSHEIVAVEEDLQRLFGTKVRIQAKKKRGTIVIEYYSLDDLDRIIQILKS